MRRGQILVGTCLAVVSFCAWFVWPSAAQATTPPGGTATATTVAGDGTVDTIVMPSAPPVVLTPGELPAANGPLLPVPPECASPPVAAAVFRGRLESVSVAAARFEVQSELAGDLYSFYRAPGLVDVFYDDETRFLTVGQTYVVGVDRDQSGRPVSRVREAAPLFGGDAVVGLNDTDTECPVVEDSVRTLRADGAAIDTGVITPLKGKGKSLGLALLLPLAVAGAVLVGLVVLKTVVFALGRSVRELTDSEPPVRARRHADADSDARG